MEETLTAYGRGCVTYILGINTMVTTTLRVLRICRYSTYIWDQIFAISISFADSDSQGYTVGTGSIVFASLNPDPSAQKTKKSLQ